MPPPMPHRASRTEALAMIRALVAGLTASARTIEQKTGVTNAQLYLLQQLAERETSSLGALALHARTQPSTVSLIVGRLQRARLVTRVKAMDDRRRAVITLTAAGRTLVRRAPVAPTARLFAALERLTPRETRALEAGLAPLLTRLDLPWTEPPMLFEHAASTRARSRRR